MKVLRCAAAALCVCSLTGLSLGSRAAMLSPATPSPAAASTPGLQDYDDMPPGYSSDVARRGFHDGMETARNDWQANRTMDPYHNPAFRHPPVPGQFRQEYRNAFLRGYDVATHRNRGWGWHDNGGWHDEHDNWRQNHENWDNDPYGRGGNYNPNYPNNANPNYPNNNYPNNNPNPNSPRPYNDPR